MKINGIPVEEKTVPCRFGCSDTAMGRYLMPEGCVCYPDDREQSLCVHHADRSQPLGQGIMQLVEIYEPKVYIWYLTTACRVKPENIEKTAD